VSSEEKVVQPEGKALKQAFSSLIDALRDDQHMHEREDKIREIEERNKLRLAALDKLQADLAAAVLSNQDVLGKEVAEDLEKHVSSLSAVAVELTRKKVGGRYATELDDNQLALKGESTKTFKSIEAFLAVLPFPVLDESINLKLVEGAYSANVKYDCADDIQFEFSLDCKKSAAFSKEFTPTSPEGKIRVPVSLGKTWLKKEPAPDYEELDDYVLSAAEVTAPQLSATYVYAEKSSTINVIDSNRDAHAVLTVEYVSADAKVNVTSEPALNKFLNSQQMEKSAEALRASIQELESFKIDLMRLVSGGKVVFEEGKLDAQEFLSKAWGIIGPRVKAALGEHATGGVTSDGRDALDETFVRQRIELLGEAGKPLLASLSLS